MEQTVTHVHKFEEAGLGVAPFRFVTVVIRKYQACHGAPVQPGGCCAYCGEGIMECCVIQDAKGKRFEVGNVCVGKTGDVGLINLAKREVNRLKTEARHAREAERISAAQEVLARPEVQAALVTLPHPFAHQALKGLTRLDWAQWMMAHAGNSGKMDVARYLDALPQMNLSAEQVKEGARMTALRQQQAEEQVREQEARNAERAALVTQNAALVAALEPHCLWTVDGGYAENFAASITEQLRRAHYSDLTDGQKNAVASVLVHGMRGRAREARRNEVLDFLFLERKTLPAA